ncbi:MAG: carboxypeptidase regulatory-like domain-containing protein, partial [Asgard group archaeon]|nr:carboxypeptidase regulatory-like domain-containing protein [Asgard group archaeon]
MKRKFANKIVIGVILFLLISSSIMILNVKASLPQEPIYPSYSGYVKDSNGNPLSNAHLQLIDLGSQVAEDYTDSNGYYCFYTDMVSSPGLKASKTDYKSETISVSTSGGTYNFYLESLGSKYTGFVKDKTGDSIANALVKLLSFGNKASQDYTSTDGSFELYGENVYYAELEASKSGYITKTIDVSDTGGTYTIELEKQLYTFDGYVRDTNDNSLANADVKLYSNNNYITSDKTDSNGYYSMQHELIKNGEIKVTKEWYQSASKTVTNTGGTYNFALEFIPHIELTGKVTHSEKNYGIPDVTVRVYKKGTSPYNNAVTTTTDNDGEFCLGIEEDSDEYILLARHPYYFSKGKRFVPDTNADFSFVLKERIDRTHLNYFENFEGQISDAWNWIYEDQDDIQITYSDNEDLIDDFSYGDTKLIKFEYDTKPSSYLVRDITKNLASPLLISFKAAFNTPSSFTDTYGYVDFTINDDMGDTWQLQIGFYTDSIQLFAPPDHPTYHTSGYLLQDHLIPKQLYQIDIILNTNEQNENIVYSIYINGEYAKSASTERKGISTDKIEIGQHVHSYTTQFYMDDLYINNVYINTLEENKPLNIASPLCWVFAPDAEGVENYYKIIHTLNVDFTLS